MRIVQTCPRLLYTFLAYTFHDPYLQHCQRLSRADIMPASTASPSERRTIYFLLQLLDVTILIPMPEPLRCKNAALCRKVEEYIQGFEEGIASLRRRIVGGLRSARLGLGRSLSGSLRLHTRFCQPDVPLMQTAFTLLVLSAPPILIGPCTTSAATPRAALLPAPSPPSSHVPQALSAPAPAALYFASKSCLPASDHSCRTIS